MYGRDAAKHEERAMGRLLEFFLEHPIGLACQLAWPLFRDRRSILTVQFGIGASYALHYALLGAWSGAGVASLGATQTALALLAGERPWLRRMGLVFLPVLGGVGAITWDGASSLLALTACALVMIGRMQADTLRLRILLLCAAPFGIGYDASVGALPALVGACVSAGLGVSMLAREIRARRSQAVLAA
jgi:hypothetical protein